MPVPTPTSRIRPPMRSLAAIAARLHALEDRAEYQIIDGSPPPIDLFNRLSVDIGCQHLFSRPDRRIQTRSGYRSRSFSGSRSLLAHLTPARGSRSGKIGKCLQFHNLRSYHWIGEQGDKLCDKIVTLSRVACIAPDGNSSRAAPGNVAEVLLSNLVVRWPR
jgi:hypothetical protein